MKALVGAFNQEKALVGAFSVIVKTDCGTDGSFYSTSQYGVTLEPGDRCQFSCVRCWDILMASCGLLHGCANILQHVVGKHDKFKL